MSQPFHEPTQDAAPMPALPDATPAAGLPETVTAIPRVSDIDPGVIAMARKRLRDRQNLPMAILAGELAALLSAGLWAAMTVLTGFQIGWMAVGVGVLVGYLVRAAGRGVDPLYGVVGAFLALEGCIAGNILAVAGMVAADQGAPYLDVLLSLNPLAIPAILAATFSPIDLLFYGLALYYGYKLSFVPMTGELVQEAMRGPVKP